VEEEREVKVKVKFTLEDAMKAQRGVALFFLEPRY